MNKEDLLQMINRVVLLCKEQQALGYPGEATKVQIDDYILPEMKRLEQIILLDNIHEDRFVNSFGLAFRCWNWDMNDASKLYLALLKLHEAYLNFSPGQGSG